MEHFEVKKHIYEKYCIIDLKIRMRIFVKLDRIFANFISFLKHTNNIEENLTRSLTNSTSMCNILKLKILFSL